MRELTTSEQERFDRLNSDASIALFEMSETILKKSILDANRAIRTLLKETDILDYEAMEFGPDHKRRLEAVFVTDGSRLPLEVSCYRAKTRGDRRIWFSLKDESLGAYITGGDICALVYLKQTVELHNLTKA